jgi:hypothetical protein
MKPADKKTLFSYLKWVGIGIAIIAAIYVVKLVAGF